jgi:hypothetical protein
MRWHGISFRMDGISLVALPSHKNTSGVGRIFPRKRYRVAWCANDLDAYMLWRAEERT